MRRTDCKHACDSCHYVFSHVPNCDDGGDASWLCPKCEEKRAKAELRAKVLRAYRERYRVA